MLLGKRHAAARETNPMIDVLRLVSGIDPAVLLLPLLLPIAAITDIVVSARRGPAMRGSRVGVQLDSLSRN